MNTEIQIKVDCPICGSNQIISNSLSLYVTRKCENGHKFYVSYLLGDYYIRSCSDGKRYEWSVLKKSI
jgi:hypothetical protein